ncbi:MAG TPA: hypothetical protein VKR38_10095 [Usitatibacter sp.]|nr:hypothetical protein [Usitatibacter sp.]
MDEQITSGRVLGKTIHLSWTDGPTKGTTQAHRFLLDGTVTWRSDPKAVRPKYLAKDIDETSSLVSYLSDSGYTLTVALNFEDGSTVGVASNETNWYPVRGTFELDPTSLPRASRDRVIPRRP